MASALQLVVDCTLTPVAPPFAVGVGLFLLRLVLGGFELSTGGRRGLLRVVGVARPW